MSALRKISQFCAFVLTTSALGHFCGIEKKLPGQHRPSITPAQYEAIQAASAFERVECSDFEFERRATASGGFELAWSIAVTLHKYLNPPICLVAEVSFVEPGGTTLHTDGQVTYSLHDRRTILSGVSKMPEHVVYRDVEVLFQPVRLAPMK
jgi:hypothetical protein